MQITIQFFLKLAAVTTVTFLLGCGGVENNTSTSTGVDTTSEQPGAGDESLTTTPEKSNLYETSFVNPRKQRDIVRFLNQATFGANEQSFNELQERMNGNYDYDNRIKVYEEWIDEQLAMAPTKMDVMMKVLADNPLITSTGKRFERSHLFPTMAIQSPDQLRHRFAQALSEFLVISNQTTFVLNGFRGMTDYYDMLAAGASSTYAEILNGVSTHTMMGIYLSSLHNQPANPETGLYPDENYAREIMQLFSMGLVHLNKDGSALLDENGNEIPTYDQSVITEMARVFTGLSPTKTANGGDNERFFFFLSSGDTEQVSYTEPMRVWRWYHDFGEKTLFTDQGNGGTTTYVEATPWAEKTGAVGDIEINNVVNALVAHSSTAPRISRLLIQHFVTSNPSPEYIERVALKFGETGDMTAVIKAILLDDEARDINSYKDASFGKQISPLHSLMALYRVTGLKSNFYLDGSTSGLEFPNANQFDNDAALLRIGYGNFTTEMESLAAPSVFNFYSPDFVPPGVLNDNSLKSPELQILTESTQLSRINTMYDVTTNGIVTQIRSNYYDLSTDDQRVYIDYDSLAKTYDATAGDEYAKAAAVVDYLDFYFNASLINLMSGKTGGTRDAIIEGVVNAPDGEHLNYAVYGVAVAPESMILK